MFVSCECCVLSGKGLWTGRSLIQRSLNDCVCVCVRATECDQMLQSPSTSTRVGGNIASGVASLGNISWMLFQEGRNSKLKLRQGVGRLLALVVNPVASILEIIARE